MLQPLAGELGASLSRQMPAARPSAAASGRGSIGDRLGARGADVVGNLRHGNAHSPAPSTSVSSPTPKPSAIGSLPNRNIFRRNEVVAPAAPVQEKAPEPAAAAEGQPAAAPTVTPSAPVKSELLEREEKLGTLGLTASAVAACVLVFFLARIMNIF